MHGSGSILSHRVSRLEQEDRKKSFPWVRGTVKRPEGGRKSRHSKNHSKGLAASHQSFRNLGVREWLRLWVRGRIKPHFKIK